MLHNEPEVVICLYDFYKTLYLEIHKWPKPERYNLGRIAEELTLEILEKALYAWRTNDKRDLLFQANLKLQLLKIILRLAKDIKIIKLKKYLFLEKELFEIGRQIGNWQKKSI